MRQITRNACNAFINGADFNEANTSVIHETLTGGDVSRMYLHGNLIAEQYLPRHASDARLRVTLAGWPTPTTRERLNGLLESLHINRRFYQHRHAQYFGSTIDDRAQEIDAHQWVTL